MKISQKGLYALKAMTMLARRFNDGAIRIRDIAYEEELPEKFLELILLELKNARMVESMRGAKGGYRLRRPPDQINLAEIISLIETETNHRALYQVFLDVRNAAARILENTSLADLIEEKKPAGARKRKKTEHRTAGPAVVHDISKGGSRRS